MDNLDEFFKGNEQEAPQEPEVATDAPPETPIEAEPPVEAPKAEQPRGPDGKFIPKGETQAEPAAASPAAKEPELDHPALIGERRRRQEAEDKLRQLEERLTKLETPQPIEQAGPPDRWEDPDGYDQWLIEKAGAAAREQALHAYHTQRINASANAARAKYQDYDEAISVFGEMIQNQPGLYERMVQAENPAEFAYTQAKTEIDIRSYGSLDALVQARVAEALKTAPQPSAPIPETLADAQSSRGSTAAPSATPKPLSEFLGAAFR